MTRSLWLWGLAGLLWACGDLAAGLDPTTRPVTVQGAGGGAAGGGNGGGAVGGGSGGGATGGGSGGGAMGGGAGGGSGGGAAGGGSGGGAAGGGSGGGGATGVELNVGWIGGACTGTASCSASGYTQPARCETTGFTNGYCTQACVQTSTSWVCPDAAQVGGSSGNTLTRCISANGLPRCVAECDFTQSPTGCRPGYACMLRQRYANSSKIFAVCMPQPDQRWPGEAAPANDIGGPCATDQACAQNRCMSMSGGYCTKTMCASAGCPSGSTCFGIGQGQTTCLKDCTVDANCRTGEGYECHKTYGVCWPKPAVPVPWNPSVGASDCLVAWGTAGSGLSPCDTTKDQYIVVHKSARNMALCDQGQLVANFQTGLGFAPVGDKEREGDGKTPEGVFFAASLLPTSQYYKAFLISYPDRDDAARGLDAGIITAAQKTAIDQAQQNCTTPPQTTDLGSYIEIHGMGGTSDWTLGCMATENANIDALWATIVQRDTIIILP